MLKKGKKLISLSLLVVLLLTLVPQYQQIYAADDPTVVTGRVLSASNAGDSSEWIEIARYGGHSLIVRKASIGFSGFGSTSYYPGTTVYNTVNNWFKNTLSSGARLRDFTVNNDSKTQRGYWAVPSDGLSKPYPASAPTAARTGDDVAFLLSFGEAASFCSTQYVINNGASYVQSSYEAVSNFNRLDTIAGTQPQNHWWLRSPGGLSDRACTVGLGGFNNWGSAAMQGAVNQYQISSNIIGVRPALWVGSGIFESTVMVTLSYDVNAPDGVGAPPPQTAPANSVVTISSTRPSRPNYTFQGWSESPYATNASYQPGDPINIGLGKVLFAVWGSARTVYLYFDLNYPGAPTMPPQPCLENSDVIIPPTIPTRPGYEFVGWSLNRYSTIGEYQPGGTIRMGTTNITLYAIWRDSVNMRTLTYISAPGTGGPLPQTAPANSDVIISDIRPFRENYSFIGWSLTQNSPTAQYQPGGIINMGPDGRYLYAVWVYSQNLPQGVDGRILPPSKSGDKVDWIEIARYANYSLIVRSRYLRVYNHADNPDMQYAAFGPNATYNSSSCTLRNFINNWFNGTPQYQNADSLASNARMRNYTVNHNAMSRIGTASKTVSLSDGFSIPTVGSYARTGTDISFALSFSESANFISNTYFERGGLGATPSNDIAKKNMQKITIPPSSSTPDRRATGAWLRSPGDVANTAGALTSGPVVNLQGRAFQLYLSYGLDGTFECGYVYPALWVEQGIFDEIEYTLYYNANGGINPPPPVVVPANTNTVISSITPTKVDFEFRGWSPYPASSIAEYQPGDLFNIGVGDKTLYAVWGGAPIQHHMLTYDANGGTGAPPAIPVQENKDTILSTIEPSRQHYKFIGWSLNQNATSPSYQPSDTFNIGNSPKTLYAVWESITRTVTGYVWPIAVRDWGLGETFLRKHDITVELRPTFRTDAAPGLTTTAKTMFGSEVTNIGEFRIENVPYGNYVLAIHRAGYLIRCMNVTISSTDTNPVALKPPPSTDNEGDVFRLWWGDSTGNMRIDSLDIMMITEASGISANNPNYNPACDLNADGIINSLDIMMAVENADKYSRQYPGAGNVNFDA